MGKGNQASPPRWGSIYIYYFKFFCKEHVLIDWFFQSFISLESHGYLFYTLSYPNAKLFILLLKLFQVWPLGPFSGELLYSFDLPPSIFFLKKKYFLTLRHCQLLYAHLADFLFSPRISHFSKKPGSFYWKIVLETKIYVLDVLLVGFHCSQALSADIARKYMIYV